MEKSSNKSSKISGFYKLSPEERFKIVTEYSGLTERRSIKYHCQRLSLSLDAADRMVENLI